MADASVVFEVAKHDDFAYIYRLCELTMRHHVEADLGDCFEQIARPTIQKLLDRGLFCKIYLDQLLVGAMASEEHDTHVQLEEIYLEPACQNQGIGTLVMTRLINRAESLGLPIRLHVLASNGARAFYDKLGFTVTRATKEVTFMECMTSNADASGV